MGARGYNVAQEGHVVNILPPQNISGGVSSQAFTLRDAAKCNIVVQFGALSGAPGALQLFAGTDSTFATSVAIGFDIFRQETSGTANDVLAARLSAPASGYFAPANANTFDVLHVQADQLPHEYPWLQLRIADGTNTDFVSAVAILTGVRYQGESNQTATV